MNSTASSKLLKGLTVTVAAAAVVLMPAAFAGVFSTHEVAAVPAEPAPFVVDNNIDERLGLMLLIHRPEAAIPVRGGSK